MNTRLVALVNETKEEPHVEHFQGMPPQFVGDFDYRKRLPKPSVLLIEEKPDGIFLFRFNENKLCGGDTWHLSVDDAKEQASYEYGEFLSDWTIVPADVDDALTFALKQS